MFLRRFASTLFALAITSAVALAQTTGTGAAFTRHSSFPPVGLAASETAQINVVNLAAASSSGTAASCTGTISFINGSGTIIGTVTPFTVTSGQISSVSLPFSKIGASGARTELRGVVTLSVTAGSGVPCALSSSLETYDTSTGATHVFLANTSELSAPVLGERGFGR